MFLDSTLNSLVSGRWAFRIVCVCLACHFTVQAQTAPRAATRVDSLRAARHGKVDFISAVVTLTNGRQVPLFLPRYQPTCFLDQVNCYETSPDQIPPPPLKTLNIERLKEMTVEGRRYESLYLKGKPLKLLAQNLADPGPVELFGYAKTKDDMLVPMPLPGAVRVFSTGTHQKYYWYVRNQGVELLEVPRSGDKFAEIMSAFFAANTSLAARIQQKEKGARFENMVELVAAYNNQPAAK